MELDRRRLKLEASVVMSRFWLRAALLVFKPKSLGMMSDSWSHAVFDLPEVPGVIVLSAVPGTEAAVVVSEMVTLMALTPEMAERVSQTFGLSAGDVGETLSMLISAVPRSFWALLVIGAEMDRTSGLSGFFDRRCGKGNLSLVEPPILDFDQQSS